MDKLNLSDFVSETITEIAIGIEKAKDTLKDLDVLINPAANVEGHIRTDSKGYVRTAQNIDFDLSVTISQEGKKNDSTDVNSGFKLQVATVFNIGLGGTIKAGEENIGRNSLINRIRFSIPVSFGTNTEYQTEKIKINF